MIDMIVQQEVIDSYEELTAELLKLMGVKSAMVTDLSTLSDFTGCGVKGLDVSKSYGDYADDWDAVMIPRICQHFKIKPFKSYIKLIDLFAMIEHTRKLH